MTRTRVLVIALSIPVIALGFAVGVRFETGLLGVLLFILIAAASPLSPRRRCRWRRLRRPHPSRGSAGRHGPR
ncbi:hypothetical protein BH24ACT4_BH24ACT4_21310 [soil metagenome]